MNILITGAHGQLGTELKRCFETMTAEIGPIPKTYEKATVDFVDRDDLDISDANSISGWFGAHGPYDLVVNCAAATNVDGCEKNEAEALKVNALGVRYLALEQERNGGKLVHVSTDYVFSGNDEHPRIESDMVCPISAYGRTKLAGELLASDACSRTFIVRTAWLYGYAGRNFVKTILKLAQERGRISVVGDQMGNPTSANDLAHEILRIAESDDYGIYHCTGKGTCSWFEFACAIVDAADIPCEREALSSDEYKMRFPQSADRPRYSSLDNKRLRETIGDEMRPWREALQSYLANLAIMEANE